MIIPRFTIYNGCVIQYDDDLVYPFCIVDAARYNATNPISKHIVVRFSTMKSAKLHVTLYQKKGLI